MNIIRASHLGMCFGVRDAIALALAQARQQPLTILGDLVHNQTVLASLRSQGIQSVQQASEVATPTVMITAHGASAKAMDRVRERGLQVLEATCPLVHYAHRAVAALVHDGFHPVIIGKRDHVEVRGLTGDLREFDVVLTRDDVWQLAPRDRFGVVAQTTQPIDRVRWLVALMRQAFPAAEIRFSDTVCLPTKQRQAAAVALARQCDVVVVIGGRHSNNTNELAQTCAQHCRRVVRIETASDLRAEWFTRSDTVGLTAGTSTPDELIDEVEDQLNTVFNQGEL